MQNRYEVVIGLEVHVQLATKSKVFASESAVFSQFPNTNISVISLAHPGTLPKLNKKVVEFALKMGLACRSKIAQNMYFDRKNYFYPDLPKAYQITQDKTPACIGGFLIVKLKDGKEKEVRLHHIHIEEDAGKSIHLAEESDTLLDFNRAGVPLIEVVTEPDIRSAEEAQQLLLEVRRLVRYLEISDGNMEEGSLRCDVNVSLRLKGAEKLGTRVEIKNLNSSRNVQKAIESETKRQITLLEKGEKIIQETRSFDAEKLESFGMRTKENLNDYRYFPEPDLCPVLISEEWLEKIKAEMPPLPRELFKKFKTEFTLSDYDANLLIENKETALFFMETAKYTQEYKAIANWLNGELKGYLNEEKLAIKQINLSPENLAELLNLIAENKISNSVAAQQILPVLLTGSDKSALEIAMENHLLLENNADNLEKIVAEVIAKFPDKVKEFKKGKKGLQGLFMGEIMKASKGKADPKMLNQLLVEALEKASY